MENIANGSVLKTVQGRLIEECMATTKHYYTRHIQLSSNRNSSCKLGYLIKVIQGQFKIKMTRNEKVK